MTFFIRPATLAAFACSCFAIPALASVTLLPGTTPQQVIVNAPFPNPIRVLVTNGIGPEVGAHVTWFLPQQGIRVPPECYVEDFGFGYVCETMADMQGIATLGYPVADAAGHHRITVTATYGDGGQGDLGMVRLEFDAVQAAALPVRVELVGGAAQRAVLGSAFAERIRIRALRADGSPMTGAAVEFLVRGDGPAATWSPPGSVDQISSIAATDAAGVAEAPALHALRGVGTGVVQAQVLDPVSHAYATIEVPFTNTYADGATNASFQDLWWSGPSESGWGLTVAQRDTRLFNVVYAYDSAGEPTWYTSSFATWRQGVGSLHRGNVYTFKSSPYFAYDADRLRLDWEHVLTDLSLAFDDPQHVHLSMRAPNGSSTVTSKTLTRFQFGGNTASPIQGVDGLWWGGPAQNGWGIAITERPGALFLVWFTYDAAGKPTWFVMSDGRWSDARTWTGNVYRTRSSPWLAQVYDASRFRSETVGSFELRFDGSGAATFTFDVEGNHGTLPLVPFAF